MDWCTLGTGIMIGFVIPLLIVLKLTMDMEHIHEMLHMATSSEWCEASYLEEVRDKRDELEIKVDKLQEELNQKTETIKNWQERCDALETKLMVLEAKKLKQSPEYVKSMIKKNLEKSLEVDAGGLDKI